MQTDCTKRTQLLRTTLLNKHNIYTRKNTNTKPHNTKKHNTKQSQNEKTILEHRIRQTQQNITIVKEKHNTKYINNVIKTHSIFVKNNNIEHTVYTHNTQHQNTK